MSEKNTELEVLNCNKNYLVSLYVGENARLRELCCKNNLLVGIDVSANPKLKCMDCRNNYAEESNIKLGDNKVAIAINESDTHQSYRYYM